MTKKICKWCGEEFYGGNRQLYCSENCKYKMGKYGRSPYKHAELVEQSKIRQQAKRKRPKYKGPSITEIAVLARKEGMTYGQYVYKYGL